MDDIILNYINESGSNDSYNSSSFAGTEFLLTFISVLKFKNIYCFNKNSLNECIYQCQNNENYKNILQWLDFDESKNSVDLEQAYSFLKTCSILYKMEDNTDNFYVDYTKFEVLDVIREFSNYAKEMESFVDYYDNDFFMEWKKSKSDIKKKLVTDKTKLRIYHSIHFNKNLIYN